MTSTRTRGVPRTAPQDGSAPKLWTSTAVNRFGNPFGFIAVIAATREEAIAKAKDAIKAEAGRGGYAPAERYAQNLLDHLEAEMKEAPPGVFIDWSPAQKSAKP